MMPVVPTAKRSHGFTIDSLMSKDRPRSRSRSPPASRLRPPSTSSPDPSPRSNSSTTPINLTASAEAATVPNREGVLFGHPHNTGFHPLHNNPLLLNSMKGLYNCGPSEHTAYPDSLTAAAALGFPIPMAASPHGLPAGFTPGHPGLGAAHPMLLGAATGHREHFSLYPWLMSRHGGYFSHGRFPGPDAGLLLQPFRKPKRIRTAFSPSQLLRLEHAFEKNHYVVGQERKDLAINLSLTETQVKVWFQNRRTKYKRMKAEEAENQRGDGSGHSKDPGSPDGGSIRSDGEDKPLDMSSNAEEEEEELEMELIDDEDEEIDCVTNTDEEVNLMRNSLAMESLQHQKHLLDHQHVGQGHSSQGHSSSSQGHVQFQGQSHHHIEQSRPSRSPSPSTAKTAHHVERWRTETSQVQVV